MLSPLAFITVTSFSFICFPVRAVSRPAARAQAGGCCRSGTVAL